MAKYKVKPALARFHSRYTVNPDTDCWEWNARWGSKACEFYPFFWDEKQYFAARWALEFIAGTPPGTLNACHRCDNPRCVNPAHLFVGTQKDNIHDAMKKGRFIGVGRKAGFTHSIETRQKISIARRARSKAV